MTNMAVTVNIWASASEAALLVASFTSISLDLGMTRCLPRRLNSSLLLYSERPTTSIRLNESPLSEYRQLQNRIVLRRQFGSDAAGLCTTQGVFGARLSPEPFTCTA